MSIQDENQDFPSIMVLVEKYRYYLLTGKVHERATLGTKVWDARASYRKSHSTFISIFS